MFEVVIDGKKVNAAVSFYTMQLYEAEFRADIIQDFFGVQDDSAPIAFDKKGEAIVQIDFTKIQWNSIAKALWAACKTATETTPSFTAWLKRTQGVNMWLVREQLANELSDCFFRPGATEEGAEEQEE